MKKFLITVLVIIIIIVGVIIYINKIQNSKTEMQKADVENNETTIEKDNIKEEIKDFEWETDTPENHNVNKDVLNELNNSLLDTEVTTSVIVKDGKIINEYYKDGYNDKITVPIHSCSKSITSSLIGIAIDKGYIESVDVPVSNYIPEIQNKDITIRHLLTNTSGIQSVENEWYEWRASNNWIDYILNKPMVSTPGTTFSYSTGNTHLLSAIMQKATGKTLFEFGKENVFDKVGMKSINCDSDTQGISDGGNGYTLTSRDMARYGLLYAQNGKWQDEQIVPQKWIEESTSVQFERDSGTADYGYQWWVRTFGDKKYKAYFAQGFGCQFIFVIPEINLVVTFSSNYNSDSNSSMYWEYVNDIVNACN